jgi:hypothetical protein
MTVRRIALLGFALLVAAPAIRAQDDPDLERLRAKQKQARELLEEVERAVELLKTRLQKTDPEAAKRLTAAWEIMRKQVIKEDMEEIERSIASKNLLAAIRKIDEVIAKLEEVLRMLLGASDPTKEETPKLSELRKELDEILKRQEANKADLDKLRKEADKGLDDFLGGLDKLIQDQGRLREETARVPEASLLDLLKRILAQIVKAREGQEGLAGRARGGSGGLAEPQLRLKAEAEAIDPPMGEAFKQLHDHGGDLAHKFRAAREHVKTAARQMDEARGPLAGSDPAAALPAQEGAATSLRTAENLIREIINALEDRRQRLPELQKRQEDVAKRTRDAENQAGKIGESLRNPDAKQAMREAQEALKGAGTEATQAAQGLQGGRPSGAQPPQQKAQSGMEKAREAAGRAQRSEQSKMDSPKEEKLKELERDQKELEKKTDELARKMGEAGPSEALKGAQGDMNRAAGQMGGQNPQQGQQGNQGQQGGRDLPGASKSQEEAIKKLREARDQARRDEQEQMLNELEKRLLQMIEEQKKINATTLDLDNRKRTMGELTRTERLQVLKPTAESQGKLSEIALECKGIAEGAEAPEIGWAFGMVATEMKEVSKLLDDNQTGALTQRKEAFILRTLEALLQAVREKKAQNARGNRGDEGQQQPPEGGEEQPQEQPQEVPPPNNDPLGVEAELRLLIELQKHLKWETEEIGRLNQGKEELNRVHRDIMGDVKGRQGELVERLRRVISRVEGKEE